MGFLDIMGRVVSILVGIVNFLTGTVTLADRWNSYIKRHKEKTAKDPSASLPASDGSGGDCVSNR